MIIVIPPETDLTLFVRTVYDLSKPQGMGYMHYKEGPLPEEDLAGILTRGSSKEFPVNLDYHRGRACKMSIYRELSGIMFMPSKWFDHTDRQLKELCEKCSIPFVTVEHDYAP